ncbi:hypothetical protein [Arthrobacter sedimenti]|uniref:hypothetical protein n=1 Tax=Arthrobacter sedimenti TaxID=2694931 RepID=UPI000B3548E0|nr:hypothetical protein [Arthrobacter sedimenti]OUM45090.1 hypothetical protein B8W73_01170 [Arthrobacter agilis]
MTPTHDTPTAISEAWFSGLAEAVHTDREAQVIGKYSDFWIGAASSDGWRVALNFRNSELVPASWDDLPEEHILISATQAGWHQIFDPQPKPLHHDLLALAKNSPDVTVGGSNVELVRNLRVIARLIDLGKALHVQH